MSDNGGGGGGKRGGLSGGKGSVWEGGIRVPFIVRGPGVAAGSWCHAPVEGEDLLPTFCEWAGVPSAKLPKCVEGGSIAGLLRDGGQVAVKRPREELVFHFPHYQSGHAPHSAIRVGNLKLILFYEDDSVKLFDLGESDDLSAARPADATRLKQRLEEHLADVGAQLPKPNPAYDPKALPEERPRKSGKGGGGKRYGKGSGEDKAAEE